jgi:hypothetical protein
MDPPNPSDMTKLRIKVSEIANKICKKTHDLRVQKIISDLQDDTITTEGPEAPKIGQKDHWRQTKNRRAS